MFQVDLSQTGNLLLHLPTGRALEIDCSEAGMRHILRILSDYKRKVRNQPGYINHFPTQHVVEKWLKEDRIKKIEEKKKALGIDLDKLQINI